MSIAFFDIDGTLATGRNVPESAEKALAQMRANGHLVFICTGRPRAYAEKNFGQYADGFVCNNGRLAFMGDRKLHDRALTAGEIASFVADLDAAGSGYAFLQEWDAYYGGNPAYRHIAEQVWGQDMLHDGIDPEALHAFNFDIYFADAAHRQRIAAALGDRCLVNPHGPHPSADVTVLGCDKGDAIINVAQVLDVPIEDVFAFGDGINDQPMLRVVGHGVAMGNAVDELKAIAEYVTTDINDNGVKNALAHYGLI
ncbi:MAG: HAD-IIB family hydrolase [Coriobacteriales bacterium]|nr:HAD-IIB family hydrolase [Coriobacteriales bacterium]